MKTKTTKNLVIQNILLLIPFICYGLFKNGYLIYNKNLTSVFGIFKPLYLILISVVIKVAYDLIIYHKIKIDYNFIYLILIAMIMPYNINLIIYSITLLFLYILTNYLEKYIKFNKVCLIYLIIILINSIFNDFTFLNPLESKYLYSFSFFDLLMGRNIGGIASTSIFFSLFAYIYYINSIYYKKDIPLFINLTYLILAIIYFVFTNNNSILLNSELIFASIFISALPEYSPYKRIHQIMYSILIGLITFIISLFFNSIISIYIATLLISLLVNIRNNLTKNPFVK